MEINHQDTKGTKSSPWEQKLLSSMLIGAPCFVGAR
jgi:hypothetical protein